MKKKTVGYIVIFLIVIALRFMLSMNFSSFFVHALKIDDNLMVEQMKSLSNGNFLGDYYQRTLIKGIAYPVFLYLSKMSGLGYGHILTLLYISSCLFFVYALKRIVKEKWILIIVFTILLFNPISYSSELYQRLYRNSLSYIEILFFLGAVINIIASKKNNILNYVFLGMIVSIMFLTKEDTIWAKVILLIVFIFKLYKNVKLKNICLNLIPILIIILNLNIVSFLNYKKYNIYTYNELTNSYFKDAYTKILQIKDDKKTNKVAIPKSTFIKLCENSKTFGFTKEEINKNFFSYVGTSGEIKNSNIIWVFRTWVYRKHQFKDGKEANEYFHKLSNEMDQLFKEGKLKKEFAFSSVFMNPPRFDDIKQLPKNLWDAIYYTSTYKNIKTFSEAEMQEQFEWDETVGAYKTEHRNSHTVDSIINNNPTFCEIIRKSYKYFTIIFSILGLLVYLKNIKIKDYLNLIVHTIVLIYLFILAGVTYTHTTGFDAIRYCYLGNIYILQNLFILLNLYRLYSNTKEKRKNKTELQLLESGEKSENKSICNNSSI